LVATLCATVHANEPSATIPTRLVASIEEWKGASYRVELVGGGISYFDNLSGRTRRISVPAERWAAFRRRLDSAKVWSWRAKYIDLGIVDGTVWRLEVAYGDRKVVSEGFNAYPPKKQFEEFRAAVQDLTGGKRFE
jgi:hypothetical protein